MPRPMNESEKQQHFGEYGFQPLRPVMGQQTTQLAEELENEDPPLWHEQKHHLTQRETIEAEALLRADRSPSDWDPLTVLFDGKTNQQLAGIQIGRETIMLFNGTGNILLAKSESGLAANSNKNFTLYEGASCSIDTEGELWGFAVAGAQVSVVSTFYDLDQLALTKGIMNRSKQMPVDTNGKQTLGAQ
jgi:hypothetical protein